MIPADLLHNVWEVPDEIVPVLWFFDHGIRVFPTNNKVPAVPSGTSQFDYRCSRAQAARFREYGVPGGMRDGYADGLTIVDADKATTKAWAVAKLPHTPFTVTTGPCHDGSEGRGLHLYLRTRGPLPSTIHRDGLSLENRNQGLYVIGPGSIRPDGVVYRASEWSWRWEDIPYFPDDFIFDDGSCGVFSQSGQPLVLPEVVVESERHATLHKIMRSLAAHGVPLDGALKTCRVVNQTTCSPPLRDNALDKEIDHSLGAYLRRAYQQKDRADFVRSPKTGWELAGALCAIGLSVEAVLVAVRSVTPDFDPLIPNVEFDLEASE